MSIFPPYSWIYRFIIIWLTYNKLRRIAGFQAMVNLGLDISYGLSSDILPCVYSKDHAGGEAAS